MTRPRPCPGAQRARGALCRPPNSNPRLPLFPQSLLAPGVMENATSSCGSQDSNSATGRCRWFKPRASARHPYQTLSAVAQSRTRRLVSSRPTSSPDTSQFDAILPANTRQPLGRQLIPKTHGRFILAQASHCGSSPSSADPPRRCRIMATLTCVTLLFAVGRASTSRPSTCERRRHWPPPRCRRARATREHARYRWRCSARAA